MRPLLFCTLIMETALLCSSGFAQALPVPRGVRQADAATQNNQLEPPVKFKHRIDRAQVQREAAELSKLAQTIPADADQLNKGLLPKDMIDKLKQIEKLAKELRSQVAPP